jgi:hypothetical protein
MPGSWNPVAFPQLGVANYTITSPVTNRYNCIAWAAGETSSWWWPDPRRIGKWPSHVPREETIDAFILAFGTLGYVPCADASLEAGFEKVALYAGTDASGKLSPTHAARQLPNGNWTSKLGPLEDIEHQSLDALNGPSYGATVSYLKRPL